tara:strand:+ start:169 stop:1236 length:1068 start_codon:yes stop_codon:yes gene_type:complete
MKKKSLNVKNKNRSLFFKHLKNKKIKSVNNKFLKNLKILNFNDSLAAAISGGPDSLALAFLLKNYEIKNNVKVRYYIVDHKLRAESADEAKTVKNKLKKYRINCKILSWKGKKPTSNIQGNARNIRYQLIYNECIKQKIPILLTAHHFDDLHENFYLRVIRGSGLKGISSFTDVKSSYKKLSILRPLIEIDKKDLIYITEKVFNFFISDPSNKNNYFKRIKIRKILSSLEEEGLNKNRIKLTLNNLKNANSALDYFTKQNLIKNSKFFPDKNIYILNKLFFQNPQEVLIRSISNILKTASKRYYSPRGENIINLLDTIIRKKKCKMTLGGCIIEKFDNSVIICAESRKKHLFGTK